MFANNTTEHELKLSHVDAADEIEDLKNLNEILRNQHTNIKRYAEKRITALLISNLVFVLSTAALMLYIGLTR